MRGGARKGRSDSSGPLLHKSVSRIVGIAGALLEAYADVRCKAEPLQKALVDAEARANAQRCLAVLWSRGPADGFAAAAAGVLTALEAADDALGPVAAAEALIMAARTRRDGAPLPLPRLVRAAMKHPALILHSSTRCRRR